MAQVESPTNKLYAACGLAIAGSAHDAATHIALDKGDMSSNNEATNAAISEASESGLARAAATVTTETTSVTNDTTKATKAFTCGVAGPVGITGFLVMTAGASGNALMWCAFASTQNLESGDILTCTGNMQFKKD